jgi:hypothetical protein
MSDGIPTIGEKCPRCKALCIVTLGNQKHCNQCGNQWPNVHRVQQGPTRREVLNGTARYIPGRIILFRT